MGYLERTLAMVKPDAIDNGEAILDMARAAGFTVLQQRRARLSPEEASEFYAEHYGKKFFDNLVKFMSSGPIMAIVLAKPGAVADWRTLIGPTDSNKARIDAPDSVRARFGTDGSTNAVHGSDSDGSAAREIRFFFPASTVEPLTGGPEAREYLGKNVNPTLTKGLTALCKAKPADPITWLADWLVANNPNKPGVSEPE